RMRLALLEAMLASLVPSQHGFPYCVPYELAREPESRNWEATPARITLRYPLCTGAAGSNRISGQETGLCSVGACAKRSASKSSFRRSTIAPPSITLEMV